MFTYQIKIEYLGTNFVGWQRQKNDPSVQEVLEKVLLKRLKEKITNRIWPNRCRRSFYRTIGTF